MKAISDRWTMQLWLLCFAMSLLWLSMNLAAQGDSLRPVIFTNSILPDDDFYPGRDISYAKHDRGRRRLVARGNLNHSVSAACAAQSVKVCGGVQLRQGGGVAL